MSTVSRGLGDITNQAILAALGNRVYNLPIFTPAQTAFTTDPPVVYSHNGVMYTADISGTGTLVPLEGEPAAQGVETTCFYVIALPPNATGTDYRVYKGADWPGNRLSSIPDGLMLPGVPYGYTPVGLVGVYNPTGQAAFTLMVTSQSGRTVTIWNIAVLPSIPLSAA